MLRLDMLIAKNQDLLLYEDIHNLTKKFCVQLFRQVYAGVVLRHPINKRFDPWRTP